MAAATGSYLLALHLKIPAELLDLLTPTKNNGISLLVRFTLKDSLCAPLLPNLKDSEVQIAPVSCRMDEMVYSSEN